MYEAVGTPTLCISSFAKVFDPSMRAAAAVGPNAAIPASESASTTPATSGASGPTTTRSASSSLAARTMPSTSSAATSMQGTRSRAMPAFPGAASSSGRCGLRSNARTIACSRPPPPTTRTRFTGLPSERGDELVDRDRGQRLVASRPPRPELERDAGHGLLVGRLDDVHEVVLAEHRPLGLDAGPQLLHLAVDLVDPRRIVLQRLDALGRERREHDVGRQVATSGSNGLQDDFSHTWAGKASPGWSLPQPATPVAAYAACAADAPASTSTAAREDGGIRSFAAAPQAKSIRSVIAIACIQPWACFPRRMAIRAPSPIVRSRAPIAWVRTFTAGRSASRPIQIRPVQPGVAMKPSPNTILAAATPPAICLV